ncbi:MAG TPA: LamG domain-containing protein, partial [Polyangia bacterium]|nr:LamG domain-containing protein [Polyangia bacterium]
AGSGGSPDAGGAGTGAPDASAETRPDGAAGAPCPGAGKALHFQDDLGGTKTKSTQVWADLGADTPIGDSPRTVEMWLYMEGPESWKAEHSIIEYGGTGRCQAFGIDGGDTGKNDPAEFDPFTFSAGGPCKGDDNNALSPQPPRTGWLHLAWVYDPAGGLAYLGQTGLNFMFTVDGVPQNIPDKKQMGALLTMKTKISIGSGQTTDDGFTGKMDELRIWNVARSAQQIADNYRLILTGAEPGLVAYYHFDEGAGSAPKDSSSAHHDAAFNTDGGRPVPTWVDSTDLVLGCK